MRRRLVSGGKRKRADYILDLKPNIPVAVIETKANKHSVGDGMQQALDYAETLNVPFPFSSNGDGFLFHDRTGASTPRDANPPLDAFPSPADLWTRHRAWKGLTPEAEATRGRLLACLLHESLVSPETAASSDALRAARPDHDSRSSSQRGA